MFKFKRFLSVFLFVLFVLGFLIGTGAAVVMPTGTVTNEAGQIVFTVPQFNPVPPATHYLEGWPAVKYELKATIWGLPYFLPNLFYMAGGAVLVLLVEVLIKTIRARRAQKSFFHQRPVLVHC